MQNIYQENQLQRTHNQVQMNVYFSIPLDNINVLVATTENIDNNVEIMEL